MCDCNEIAICVFQKGLKVLQMEICLNMTIFFDEKIFLLFVKFIYVYFLCTVVSCFICLHL